MTTKTYTVTFGVKTFTRTTDADYPFAAYAGDPKPFAAPVTFHKTYAAAKRKAGRYGEVKRTVTV